MEQAPSEAHMQVQQIEFTHSLNNWWVQVAPTADGVVCGGCVDQACLSSWPAGNSPHHRMIPVCLAGLELRWGRMSFDSIMSGSTYVCLMYVVMDIVT